MESFFFPIIRFINNFYSVFAQFIRQYSQIAFAIIVQTIIILIYQPSIASILFSMTVRVQPDCKNKKVQILKVTGILCITTPMCFCYSANYLVIFKMIILRKQKSVNVEMKLCSIFTCMIKRS